jgi:hypothetical protein
MALRGASGALPWMVRPIAKQQTTGFQTGSDHRDEISVLWSLFRFLRPKNKTLREEEKSGCARSMELDDTGIFPEEKWFIRKVLS